jgi:outer membrane lipoprotein SlyB
MTTVKWLSIMASLCSAFLPLHAQTSDWSAVEKIPPGTSISVVKRVRQGCELAKVTDSELACDRQIGEVERRLVFARGEVQEVRLEEPEHNRMIAGAIIGGVVGGLVGFIGGGQAGDPEARGYARALGIPIDAVLGGAIGRNIHRHGAIIYRRR